MPVKVFFCYAREDEPYLTKLKSHLQPLQRQGLIDVWYDRDINAGTEWESEINQHLNTAQIILLLVSPDFMASDYINNVELKRALERHEQGEARVIPIILRHVYWQGEPLGKLQALPTDALPVIDPSWHNLDRALFNVAEGIRKVVLDMQKKSELKYLGNASPATNPPPFQTSRKLGANEIVPKKKPSKMSIEVKVALIGVSGIILAALISGIFILRANSQSPPSPILITPTLIVQPTGSTLPTPAAQALYAQVISLNTILDDPLKNQGTNKWDENATCIFTGKAYHVYAIGQFLPECFAQVTDFSNFAFQVQMTVIKGDGGGLIFRSNEELSLMEYRFFVSNEDTHFDLVSQVNTQTTKGLVTGHSQTIKPNQHTSYLLTVIARGSFIYLYLNGQFLAGVEDGTFTSGKIGLFALNYNGHPTEMAFGNVKVWKL